MQHAKSFRSFDFETGEVLLVDKPLGWTSFDVVAKLRNATRCSKIGHAGTLDPLATGLLILCTGKKTKEIEQIQNADKVYEAAIRLGYTTPSYDAEFEPVPAGDVSTVTREMLLAAMQKFVGQIQQTPPAFSAIKVQGKRAYASARAGKAVELKPRTLTIHAFDLLSFDGEVLTARIHCQKGTYVRSLAHDLGQALGVGGYLAALRRTHIGTYAVQDARTVEAWLAHLAAESISTNTATI